MQKKVMVLLVGGMVLALAGVCIVQHRKIQSLSAECSALSQAAAAKAAAPDEVAPSAALTAKGLPEPLSAAPEHSAGQAASRPRAAPVAMPPESKAESVAKTEAPSAEAKRKPLEYGIASDSTNESPLAAIGEMLKSPAMKDMIRAQMVAQIDLTYGSLFKYLKLSDADLDAFKGLLIDKSMAGVGDAMDAMNKSMTPEERKAAVERFKTMNAEHDARIKEFLTEDAYAVYQSFEETQPERMQIQLFKGGLASGEQLTDEQEDHLIRALYSERTNSHSSVMMKENELPDPSRFTPEQIAKQLDEHAKLQEKSLVRAATILTPSQIEQFKANQKQQQAMMKMGLKMTSQMFGKGAATTSDAKP